VTPRRPAAHNRFAALAVLVLAIVGCDRGADRPGREILPDMARSIPYDSFRPCPVTRDGKTLLAPPPGSVPRGWVPFVYGPGPAEAARAGRELANPVVDGPEVKARGEKLWANFCFPCHGPSGQGDGPVIPLFPTPPPIAAEHARRMLDGQIFHVISRGQGVMPPHATQIEPRDRWVLVRYVRDLQGPTPAVATSTPKQDSPAEGRP
jgi:mono/diheme cytochrome c family protein